MLNSSFQYSLNFKINELGPFDFYDVIEESLRFGTEMTIKTEISEILDDNFSNLINFQNVLKIIKK